MIEEAMSITPIVFVLIILLFGFDSARTGRAGRKHLTANDRTRDILRRPHQVYGGGAIVEEDTAFCSRVMTEKPTHAIASKLRCLL